MYCNECGRKIPDSFIYCGYCGTKIVAFSNHCNDNTYKATYNRNPILNSPNDITDDLIKTVVNGKLASEIYHNAKKIYPLKRVEIIKSKVIN